MTKQIPLIQGKFALVDDEDYEYLMQWKWTLLKSKYGEGYAIRRKCGKYIMMHRVLTNANCENEVDHINGNKLDNRKNNLRQCSKSLNNANRQRYRKDRFGKYKGVFLDKRNNRWRAQIRVNKKSIHIGTFSCQHDAATQYNLFASKYFGEFAKLNEIHL